MDWVTLLAVSSPLFAGGAAWGGAMVALNGTRKRVRHVESRQTIDEELRARQHVETVERLAKIETKLDMMLNGDR